MRVLLVTSALTFVPENYDRFILPMADCDEVIGLVVIENRSMSYCLKGMALVLTGAAPRLGVQILKNLLFSGLAKRRRAFESRGKSFSVFKNPNQPEMLELVKDLNVDLVLNARTRFIYRKGILSAPRLGCLNVHHGLLPQQKGLMCDFWAHLDRQPFGFSIHQMTLEVDQGDILSVVETGRDSRDYLKAVLASCDKEVAASFSVFEKIKSQNGIEGTRNQSMETAMRLNPGLKDFYQARKRGIRI
jgi:methionyl-tRNA formyltransferase